SSRAQPPALRAFPTRRSSDLGQQGHGQRYRTSQHRKSKGLLSIHLLSPMSTGRLPDGEGGGSSYTIICPSSELAYHIARSVKYRDRKSTRLNSSHVKISYAVV